MVLWIVVGWMVVLPMLVVGGLYAASKVLSARARVSEPIDASAVVAEMVSRFSPRPAAGADRTEKSPVGSGY